MKMHFEESIALFYFLIDINSYFQQPKTADFVIMALLIEGLQSSFKYSIENAVEAERIGSNKDGVSIIFSEVFGEDT